MRFSPSYTRSHEAPATPADLKEHRCLHYGYQASGSNWRLQNGTQTKHGHETVSVPVKCTMWSNNGQVLCDAAIAGQGIALLPVFIVSHALQAGALITLLKDHPPVESSLMALYPRHRHLSAKVQLFLAAFEDELGNKRATFGADS